MRRHRMTDEQHRETGRTLVEARQHIAWLVRQTLNRRVPAPVLDAALKVDQSLFALSLRLAGCGPGPVPRARSEQPARRTP